jgi:hypothetical protein
MPQKILGDQDNGLKDVVITVEKVSTTNCTQTILEMFTSVIVL